MTVTTAESLEEFFSSPERRARLLAASEAALMEKLAQEMKWGLPDVLSKICNDFIETEVAPVVRAHLTAQKGVIVSAAIAAADEVGQRLAEALVAKATANLAGYQGRAVLKGLFE